MLIVRGKEKKKKTSLGKTTTTKNNNREQRTPGSHSGTKQSRGADEKETERKEEKTQKRDTNSQIIPSTALYHRQSGRLQHLHRGLRALAASLRGNRTHRGFVTHSHHRGQQSSSAHP